MSGFAVIDCETTGLSPESDSIIEIGIIALSATGEYEGEWSHLVNPERPVAASEIHGIRDHDVAEAPTFSELVAPLVNCLSARVIVAHNVAFDVAFLNAEFARAGYPMTIPLQCTACTMELSKIYLPPGSHSLAEAMKRARLEPICHHRALVDAHGAARLFQTYLHYDREGIVCATCATSRTGRVTRPGEWRQAQTWTADLWWPAAHDD